MSCLKPGKMEENPVFGDFLHVFGYLFLKWKANEVLGCGMWLYWF